jgi:arylsulfatase A-like enzyme
VPLIFRWPGRIRPGARVDALLQMNDVAPTLLQAVGIEVPEEMEGVGAWDVVRGGTGDVGRRQVVSLECTWQAKWSLRDGSHKLIVARDGGLRGGPPRELYDLRADPGETRDIWAERPGVAAAMEEELEGWIANRLQELGRQADPLREQGISLRHMATA